MQIEQVVGGVNGDASAQAIQLRMRSSFQNQMQESRLVVRDAAGTNPIVLIDMTSTVPNHGAGVRVLIASSSFQSHLGTITPDFVMTNLIPPSYLAAGSLTFEDDFGTVYWRLSWGGASYVGLGTGTLTNDSDGIFNPPFADALPSGSGQALLYRFAATAASTDNANDYELTAGPAVFTNNAGSSSPPVDVEPNPGAGVIAMLSGPFPNPVSAALSYSVSLSRASRVKVSVFDAGGRLVRTLVDEVRNAGRHGFRWDAAQQPRGGLRSGAYYLRLDAAGRHETRAFTVIR
jgi:hypothetical protein